MSPTRFSLTTSSVIDHIATTCARNISNSGVHKIFMSDHYMVFCSMFDGALQKDPKIIKASALSKMGNVNALVIYEVPYFH